MDEQRSTKYTHKTKDRVTQTSLKTRARGELDSPVSEEEGGLIDDQKVKVDRSSMIELTLMKMFCY